VSERLTITAKDIVEWLKTTDRSQLNQLWTMADQVRRERVGDTVHLRGLVEFSNDCCRTCLYCGLRHPNSELLRYRMGTGEVLACAENAARLGYGTVVLQSGEMPSMPREWLGKLIRKITLNYGLTVTLSVGERSEDDYRYWYDMGARRCLLRFETGDGELYRKLHPIGPSGPIDRIKLLLKLRRIGYNIGSGIMVGLPGQTLESIAEDILTFRDIELYMVGSGPYIANPQTPLGKTTAKERASRISARVSLLARKVLALTRLVCPEAHIPATSALATVDKDGLLLGLQCGANVIMPRLTPEKYQQLYRIYPTPTYAHGPNSPSRAKSVLERLGRPASRQNDRTPDSLPTKPDYRESRLSS